MGYSPSRSRRWALVIAILSPALLGSEFKCVAVSNPSLATARIDQLEPTHVRVGDVIHVTASGSGTPPLQFTWDFGDGDPLAFGNQAAHVYTAPGSYRITLDVRDAGGHTARDSTQVDVSTRVSMLAPTLVQSSDAIAGKPVEFLALTPGADASDLQWQWTFSDSQSASGSHVAPTFPMAGVYLAFVTVTDGAGEIANAQIAFEVAAAAR